VCNDDVSELSLPEVIRFDEEIQIFSNYILSENRELLVSAFCVPRTGTSQSKPEELQGGVRGCGGERGSLIKVVETGG